MDSISIATHSTAMRRDVAPSVGTHRSVERLAPTPSEADALLGDVASHAGLPDRIAEHLAAGDIVAVDLAALGWSLTETRRLVHSLSELIPRALQRARVPAGLRVEVDVAQETFVPEGYQTRTLLPHHDGGHVSYLTPSRLDDPSWDPAQRKFAPHGHCEYSTLTHKLFQGLFVARQGTAPAKIGFYPIVDVIADLFEGYSGSDAEPVELARWYGENLRKSFESRARHGGTYPTLSAFAGSERDEYLGFTPHCAEAPIGDLDLERFPGLRELSARCACGTCEGPSGRVFCNMLWEVCGRTWPEFKAKYQNVTIETRELDFVLWNNLTSLHAGFDGCRARLLEPIGFVLDEPEGPDYERWLQRLWREELQRRSAAPALTR